MRLLDGAELCEDVLGEPFGDPLLVHHQRERGESLHQAPMVQTDVFRFEHPFRDYHEFLSFGGDSVGIDLDEEVAIFYADRRYLASYVEYHSDGASQPSTVDVLDLLPHPFWG